MAGPGPLGCASPPVQPRPGREPPRGGPRTPGLPSVCFQQAQPRGWTLGLARISTRAGPTRLPHEQPRRSHATARVTGPGRPDRTQSSRRGLPSGWPAAAGLARTHVHTHTVAHTHTHTFTHTPSSFPPRSPSSPQPAPQRAAPWLPPQAPPRGGEPGARGSRARGGAGGGGVSAAPAPRVSD